MKKYDVTDEDLIALAKQPRPLKKVEKNTRIEEQSVKDFVEAFSLQKGENKIKGLFLYSIYSKWCIFPYSKNYLYKYLKANFNYEDGGFFMNKTKGDVFKASLYLKETCEKNQNIQD